ncbi:MAG TPA: TolC family protein, partial [Ferruginibacter sp.]|nr:TolC family protein [Ferruginibacter sp.]
MVSISPKAQQPVKRVTNEELLKMTHKNQLYNINALQLKKIQAEQQAVSAVPKTGFFAENEDFQPEHTSGILKLGVSQSLSWPGLYKAQKNYYRQQVKYYQFANAVTDAGLKRDLNKTYYQLWFLQNKQLLYLKLDSIYTSLRAAAILKVKTGDSPGLDSISANVRLYELQALLMQLGKDMLIQQEALSQLLN